MVSHHNLTFAPAKKASDILWIVFEHLSCVNGGNWRDKDASVLCMDIEIIGLAWLQWIAGTRRVEASRRMASIFTVFADSAGFTCRFQHMS